MLKEPFTLTNEHVLEILPWKNSFENLKVGFTARNGGESNGPFQTFNLGLHVNDDKNNVITNRNKLAEILHFQTSNWICAEQTHDSHIEKITKDHCGAGVFDYNESIKGTDGIYTSEPNILLTLCFADCVPLYFYSPTNQTIGLAHAGWKGTVKDIGGKMVHKWVAEGIQSKDIYAAIGPSICSNCYLVDDYVLKFVKDVIGEANFVCYSQIGEGQYKLDLQSLNHFLLTRAGIPDENIQLTSYCTSCDSKLFFSHRRDKGASGRMMSFIGLKEDC